MAVKKGQIGSTRQKLRPVRSERMTGAQAIIKCLQAEGVDVVFGYPGGAIIPFYDALYDGGIRHILVRHEQGAAHAADGYARSTGKVGVCVATSGPGATNLVTGIATAYMDSIPMVAITGQVATSMIGKDAFQEADITGITLPITKHNYLVKDVKELPGIIREAFHLAQSGRPGPVLIDLPKDVQNTEFDFVYPESIEVPTYRPNYVGHPRQIQEAAKAIAAAERPLLYVGGGVIASDAADQVRELAEKADIPVTMTLMGIGGFPASHPLSLGMLGMHGTAYANLAVQACDLLISVGARFDDRVTGVLERFAPNASVIHIDIDPAEIGKNTTVAVPIVGDAKQVLKALNPKVESVKHPEWKAQINRWKAAHPMEYANSTGAVMPQYVIEKIAEVTEGDAIVVTEVGQNQMWTAQYYGFDCPRSFLTSGGLGTMGYGFPASIGAQVANPDRVVFAVAGDGSFQMNIQELDTAAVNNIPVKVVILNNSCLGMVRQWQELFFAKRYSQTMFSRSPDFAKIAEGYGVLGLRVNHQAEVLPALQKALAYDGPVVVDVKVEQTANVFPMVPQGRAIDEMLGIGGDQS